MYKSIWDGAIVYIHMRLSSFTFTIYMNVPKYIKSIGYIKEGRVLILERREIF